MTAVIAVALTIFAESAGEPHTGKQAVASVIWNRAAGNPDKLVAVCQAPGQFSCWNGGRQPRVPNDWPSRRAWVQCRELAESMIAGTFRPSTEATHYYAPARMAKPPAWAVGVEPVAEIGGHRFFKLPVGKVARGDAK